MDGGWLNYPRHKNEKKRRCHLWPETVASVQEWLKERPKPKDAAHERLVYLTRSGGSWHKLSEEHHASPLSQEFFKLLRQLDINGGRSFYDLRRTYRTEAGRCNDTEAVYGTMGHVLPGVAGSYVHHIHADRLQRVAETVRGWLFEPASTAKC